MKYVVSKARKTLAPVLPVFMDKRIDQLQAADLVLWEQRNVVVRRLQGRPTGLRESLRILIQVKQEWGMMQRDQLVEWAERLDIPRHIGQKGQREDAKWRPTLGKAARRS